MKKLSVSPAEYRKLEARMVRDIRALRPQFDEASKLGYLTVQQAEHFLRQLELIAERYERMFKIVPGPPSLGRPRSVKAPAVGGTNANRKGGRPLEFSPDVNARLLLDVEETKRKLREARKPDTDVAALRVLLKSHASRRLRREAYSEVDARRLAEPMGEGRALRRLQDRLARLRALERKKTGLDSEG